MALERFYEAEFPPVGAIVMAQVTCVGEALVKTHLMEYNKTASVIRQSFLRGRTATGRRSCRFRHGQEVQLRVLRVNPDTDFIDLSSESISAQELNTHKEEYHQSKMVVSILRHTCINLGLDEASCEDLARKTSWFLHKKSGRVGQAYETFKQSLNNPAVLDECDIDVEAREVMLHVIRLKLSPPLLTLRSVVEVTCFTKEGIDAIKRALRAGQSVSSSTHPIMIHVVSCPDYEVITRTRNREAGIRSLQAAQHLIEESIVQSGGQFKIVKQPYHQVGRLK